MQYITVKNVTISFDSLMPLLRHTHGSTIPRLTALLISQNDFTIVLKLQSVKKTCNGRYTRTKCSAGADKKCRCIGEVTIQPKSL